MLNKIIQTDQFKSLDLHVRKLLAAVKFSLGNSHNDYFLYLVFLITTDNYQDTIVPVDKRLQLLLYDIDKYWLGYDIAKTDLEEKLLKRDMVRYIILSHLNDHLSNMPALTGSMHPLRNFVTVKLNLLECKLEKSNYLETIYQQNMDFAQVQYRKHNHLDIYDTLPNYLSALSVCFTSFYLIDDLLKKHRSNMLQSYQLAEEDLGIFQRAFLGLHIIEFGILAGIIMYCISFASFKKLILTVPRHDFKRHFRMMNMREFNSFCKLSAELSPLTYSTYPVDTIWLRQTYILTENRIPTVLRDYIVSELDWLSKEKPESELLILLACCLVAIPNSLTDIEYPAAIDIFRKPRQWESHPNYQKLDNLIQSFVRLAMIEYMNTKLKDTIAKHPKNRQLLQWLTENQEKLIADVESLIFLPKNLFSTSYLTNLLCPHLLLSSIVAVAVATIGHLMIVENSFRYSQSKAPINSEAWFYLVNNSIGFLITLIPTPHAIAFFASKFTSVMHKIKQFEQQFEHWKEQRCATTTFFFTRKTIGNSQQLKAIFQEEYVDPTNNQRPKSP